MVSTRRGRGFETLSRYMGKVRQVTDLADLFLCIQARCEWSRASSGNQPVLSPTPRSSFDTGLRCRVRHDDQGHQPHCYLLALAPASELSAQTTNWTTVEAALGRKTERHKSSRVIGRFQIYACCFRTDTG